MRGLHLGHGLSPFSEQNPVISFLVVLVWACLQLTMHMPTSMLSAQPFCPTQSNDRVNADHLLKLNLIFNSSCLFPWNVSLGKHETAVRFLLESQAGWSLCWACLFMDQACPWDKGCSFTGFWISCLGSFELHQANWASSAERWHFERLTAVATCFRAEVWC